MVTTRPPKTIVKPTALGPVANTDTKLLIYGLFQKDRVLAQDAVAINRIKLAKSGPPAGLLRRDQGRTGPAKHIEHDIAPARDVTDGVRNHLHRLHRRMERKLLHPARPQGVDTAVLPHIRAIAAMLPKFEGIDVWRRPVLEDKNQLMP